MTAPASSVTRWRLPKVTPVQASGQPAACLDSLLRYAEDIAGTRTLRGFDREADLLDWLYAQKVVLDQGDGPQRGGCRPTQRSRIWPTEGLNCWEALAHWLAWHLAARSEVEIFVFDVPVQGQRHVFPAVRALGSAARPEPVVLQPPIQTGASGLRLRATAQAVEDLDWYRWIDPIGYGKDVQRERAERERLARVAAQEQAAAEAEQLRKEVARQEAIEARKAADRAERRDAQRREEAATARRQRQYANEQAAYEARLKAWQEEQEKNAALVAGPKAQAWYNDVFGVLHGIGQPVLEVFGAGKVGDKIAEVAGDALPDEARTEAQREARRAKKEAAEAAVRAEETTTTPTVEEYTPRRHSRWRFTA